MIQDTPFIDSSEGKSLIGILMQDGGEARFVGGCVRDALLNRAFKDIDISTTHAPETTMQLLQAHGVRALPTGIAHGTVTAVVNGKNFEITTLRKDIATDGRHATVEFTDDWREDAARRDFTMNAMSMGPDGVLHDYFGGRADLGQGIVRFVGDPMQRIEEDYLRILRLFRFHAYYGRGDIVPEQLVACAAGSEGITKLSGERIQMEMLKLLSAPDPRYAVRAMNQANVLEKLLPGIETPINLEGLEALVELPVRSNALVRLAAILSMNDADENVADSVADHWKFSSDDRRHLHSIMFPACMVSSTLDAAGIKRAVRSLGKPVFHDVVLLAWAMEGNETTQIFEAMLKFSEQWIIPKLPVRGVDILKMGVKEGREVGRLLTLSEEFWEAREYQATREQLIKLITENMNVA